MKEKKKRKKCFFFLLNDFHKNLQEKRIPRGIIIFFSCGNFFCLFVCLCSPILSPLKRTQDDEGFILYTLSGCTSALDMSNQQRIRYWKRDSVDSPSGCKVKTLMYSTFANELQIFFSVSTLF